MNIVVYFRYPVPADAPFGIEHRIVTHWIEDEGEAPQAAFTEIEPIPSAETVGELSTQLSAVNFWLRGNRATVVGTFTEMETGAKSRPSYGKARKAAIAHRATLLVATTKAFFDHPFEPTDQDGLRVICLDDPQEVKRRLWQRSTDIVLYLRSPVGDPIETAMLEKQRHALGKIVYAGIHTVHAEFIEHEPVGIDPIERPELEQAQSLCRQLHARLFIGTTDAFGSAGEFVPEFTDVPYDVAYREIYEWPETIVLEKPPYPVALLFGSTPVRGNVPVYLANATGMHVVDVTVSSFGTASQDDDVITTTPSARTLGAIETGQGKLLEAYDLFFDPDFVVSYTITARTEVGIAYSGTVHIYGPPAKNWAPVEHWLPIGT